MSEPGTFAPGKQIFRLFVKFLVRWLFTAAFCALFIIVLKRYDKQIYLQDNDSSLYTSITIGLTTCLSLNLDSSLNAYAAALKWVILARESYQPRVFDLILAFDGSKLNSIKLLWYGTWLTRLICIFRLFLTLAAPIGTAAIGLTYSIVALSPDSLELPSSRGVGYTAMFTEIGPIPPDQDDPSLTGESESSLDYLAVQRSNAFAYGISGINSGVDNTSEPDRLSFHSTMYDPDSRSYLSPIANYPKWAANSSTVWNQYGRYVNSYADCVNMPITLDNNLKSTTITFSGYNGLQTLTISEHPLDYVTYISDTSSFCGQRCATVYAVFSSNETTDLFICNSTVGEVHDWGSDELVSQYYLKMPDAQAQILAGAIGWGDIHVSGTLNGQPLSGQLQASSFPEGSYWAPFSRPNNTAISDLLIAHFTATAIKVMEYWGVLSLFDDLVVPGVASQLDVNWTFSLLVLILIPSIQALLALLCIYVVYRNKVPIHEDSALEMAALLQHGVTHFSVESLLNGSYIANNTEKYLMYTGYEVKVVRKEGSG